jgi:hypothetical protein
MSTKIAVCSIGKNPIGLIQNLIEYDESIDLSLITMNILDYKPPEIENVATQWQRYELRNVLKQLGIIENISIPESLIDLLKQNDTLNLDDDDLTISSHIDQIEANSKDLVTSYNNLQKDTKYENVSLYPLITTELSLLSFKNKKYAPLRYYYTTESLYDEAITEDNGKKKRSDKKLIIEDLDELKDVKINELAYDAIKEADIAIFVATDIVSLGTLTFAKELFKQIEKLDVPLVFLSYFQEPNEAEKEIASVIGFGTSITDFSKELANIMDYILLDKKEKDSIDKLRESGCRVILEDLDANSINLEENSLLRTIFRIGDIQITNGVEPPTINELEDTGLAQLAIEVQTQSKEEENHSTAKPISQLQESPEEAGKDTDSNAEDEKAEEKVKLVEEVVTEKSVDKVEEEIKEIVENGFLALEEEEWFDTVSRAIEDCFEGKNNEAINWLTAQSSLDNDKEVQIAEKFISRWIEMRTVSLRKKGAEMISALASTHRDSYKQILEKQMINTVTQKQEDKRRLLIPLFSILNDVDNKFGEEIIAEITNKLALLKNDTDGALNEKAKLTILQLVIDSNRLIKVATVELLRIFVSKPNIGPEIWNILIAFDAGLVGIELVTHFSIDRAEEIVRRASLLRFTGTYYTILSKVIQSMKEGDKTALSNVTGAIIPEETLRKLERLQLASKVEKLKMVQVSTLAESLGKDVKYVERLITELIVNDELQAEMQLIDDKMYLVATEQN